MRCFVCLLTDSRAIVAPHFGQFDFAMFHLAYLRGPRRKRGPRVRSERNVVIGDFQPVNRAYGCGIHVSDRLH